MMATELAMGYGQGMLAVGYGHTFPRHHDPLHHQVDSQTPHHDMDMTSYDYYSQRHYDHRNVIGGGGGEGGEGAGGGMANSDEEDDDPEDSDNESMYTSADMDSADEMTATYDFGLPEPEPNVTEQLLEFAESVNRDIQKYFGKKKGAAAMDEPGTISCEDRFASGKSGRELYYADLLRVAQSGDSAEPWTTTFRGRSNNRTDLFNSSPPHPCASSTDMNVNVSYCNNKGLGPLKELFDFALSTSSLDVAGSGPHISSSNERQTNNSGRQWNYRDIPAPQKCLKTVPWRKRSLPTSFFVEPGSFPSPKSSSASSSSSSLSSSTSSSSSSASASALSSVSSSALSSSALSSSLPRGLMMTASRSITSGPSGSLDYGVHNPVAVVTEHDSTPDFSDLVANFSSDYDNQMNTTTGH